MSRAIQLRAFLFAILAVATGFVAGPATAQFESTCRRLTEGDNAYFGHAIIPRLEERLRAAEQAATPDTEAIVRLRAWLATELGRLGRQGEALTLLTRAREAAERALPDDWPLLPALLGSEALAHLQLAEEENCAASPNPDRCILPLTDAARHQRTEHTRAAIARFDRVLTLTPGDVQNRWLRTVAETLIGDPNGRGLPPSALGPAPGLARWQNLADGLGISGSDHAGGAIVDDFDADGHLDLISSSWHPCAPLRAYRNDGQGGFQDVAKAWGLDQQLGGLNIVHADYDGDGQLDLLVLRGAWLGAEGKIRNSLLRNDLAKTGRFVDVTAQAGLAVPAYPTQAAAWGDIDNDGDLDLYIGNEAAASSVDPRNLFGMGGQTFPSQLLRNDGGRFTDIARAAGVTNDRFAKGVTWGDVDNDGDLDLFVSNIGVNRLYRNDGPAVGTGPRGIPRFVDIAATAGVAEPSRESFATWFFDVDNDGDLDLFVADYSSPVSAVSASYLDLTEPPRDGSSSDGSSSGTGHPVLYRNDTPRQRTVNGELISSSIRFTDVSADWGLDRPLLPMGANFGDLDNDGWLDIYLGTGLPNPQAWMPNVMYRNVEGQRYEDVTSAGFGHLQKGHGIAFGDIDRDGDQDLFQQLGGAYPYDAFANVLYENPSLTPPAATEDAGDGDSPPDPGSAWVTLRLRGARANPFAIGARITIVVRGPDDRTRQIHAVVGSGGSFGGSSMQQELGLGDAVSIDSLSVRWPSSAAPFVARDLAPRKVYEIREKDASLVTVEAPPVPLRPGQASHNHAGSVR